MINLVSKQHIVMLKHVKARLNMFKHVLRHNYNNFHLIDMY